MTVYLEYEGKPVPIAECSWLLVAPCGCVAGITIADLRSEGALTDAAAALVSFTPNKEQLRRDIAAGWTTRLSGKGRAAVYEMTEPNGCPHKPKWGEEPRPEADGWVWAATTKSRRSHIVPIVDENAFVRTRPAGCGREYWGWRTDAWAVADLPTCRPCEAKAREINAGGGSVLPGRYAAGDKTKDEDSVSDYTKVVIEADAKGRLNISVLDDKDGGYGHRLAGPKYNYDLMPGAKAAKVVVRHELTAEDVTEIRRALATWDEIQASKATPKPTAGQIWQDNDPRILAGRGCVRMVRISSIDDDGKATCQAWYEEAGSLARTVRIRLDRFKPTSTGYTFVRDDVDGAA